VGKGGARCGDVGSAAVHMSTPIPRLSIGQSRHVRGVPLTARRRRSALNRDHIEEMAGEPLLAWGGRSQL
jgi:hypothetical protein